MWPRTYYSVYFTPGFFGAVGGGGPVGPITCTPNLAVLSYGLQQAARAAGVILRKVPARSGLTDTSAWEAVGNACTPFQHVESTLTEQVVDGALVPVATGDTFRFGSYVDLLAGDKVWMRVGNYPDTYWTVLEEPARTTLFAMVAQAGVERDMDPDDDLVAAAEALT